MSTHERGVGEELARGPVERDAALLQDDQAVGDLRERVGVVARHDDRRPRVCRGAHGAQTGAAGTGVQAGSGLVEQQQRRPQRQHRGDGHASLLPAGERQGRAAGELVEGETHEREGARGPLAGLGCGHAPDAQAEGGLALDRGLEELARGLLEDEADLAGALRAPAPGVGRRRPRPDLEQRRLAGSGAAHEPSDAARERQRDVVERADPLARRPLV